MFANEITATEVKIIGDWILIQHLPFTLRDRGIANVFSDAYGRYRKVVWTDGTVRFFSTSPGGSIA